MTECPGKPTGPTGVREGLTLTLTELAELVKPRRPETPSTSTSAPSPLPKRMLSTDQVAELCGVVPQTVRRWARLGLITHVRISSRRLRFPAWAVQEHLRNRTDTRTCPALTTSRTEQTTTSG